MKFLEKKIQKRFLNQKTLYEVLSCTEGGII
jgi:hypothetical protein